MLSRIRAYWTIGLILSACVFGGSIYVLLCALLPFAPVRIEHIDVKGPSTCAGEFVKIDVRMVIEDDWPVERVEIKPTWLGAEANSGALPVEEPNVYVENGSVPQPGVVTEPLAAHYAPNETGSYRFTKKYTIEGHIGPVSREQVIYVEDPSPVIVMEC